MPIESVRSKTARLARDLRPGKGMPSYIELACALCDVLDGVSDAEFQNRFGLTKQDAQKIAEAREAVKPMWLEANGQ